MQILNLSLHYQMHLCKLFLLQGTEHETNWFDFLFSPGLFPQSLR